MTLLDLRKGFDSLARPAKLKEFIFWVFLFQVIMEDYNKSMITLGIYFVLYMISMIIGGKWKEKMREDYKKT